MKNRILDFINSTAAGFVGAGILLLVAFSLHWGGLGAGNSTTGPAASGSSAAASTTASEMTAAPAPGSTMTPEQIYQKYADSAVQIVSTFPGQANFFGNQPQQQGIGSGFVASTDGYILTDAHVITSDTSQTGGTAQKASDVEVDFRNGKKVKAQIVGYDLTSSDIAVLKVDPNGLNLVPAVLGDSDRAQVGEPVVAIGSPFGVYTSSLTSGVVSAVNRTVESPEAGFTISNAIQTDAAINKGNSGGPLFDEHGQVIGLNEQIASSSGGSEGVGFAVPINTAKRVMQQILSKGEVDYAFMGIIGQTVDQSSAQDQGLSTNQGALITEVQSGSPADKAGLKKGDVITGIDGKQMTSMDDVSSYISQKNPGDKVNVTFMRGKNSRSVDLTLGKRSTS